MPSSMNPMPFFKVDCTKLLQTWQFPDCSLFCAQETFAVDLFLIAASMNKLVAVKRRKSIGWDVLRTRYAQYLWDMNMSLPLSD